jgi:hypothetical protein
MLQLHLRSRFFALSAGVAGLLLLIPGVLSVFHAVRLEPGDDLVALTPLASIRLGQIGAEPVVTKLVVPDTRQWRRIRRAWGDPSFIISAVSSEKSFAYCLPDLGLSVEASLQGNKISLESSNPPYGYSSGCERSSLAFRAVSGSDLIVTITKSGDLPSPSGEVIIVSYWANTKDKLVGISLERELKPIVTATSSLGVVLIVVAAYIHLRRRSLRQRS